MNLKYLQLYGILLKNPRKTKCGVEMEQKKLIKYIEMFYQISGLEVTVMDSGWHHVVSTMCGRNSICQLVHGHPGGLRLCRDSDCEHIRYVRANPQLHIYTCPCGFYTMIAPVVQNEEATAFLMASPGFEDKKNWDEHCVRLMKELLPGIDGEQAKRILQDQPHYSKEKLEVYGEMLMLIAQKIGELELGGVSERDIARMIKQYIDRNLHNKITLANLSYQLNYSTVTLTQHFKKEYGMSIMTYATKKRMELAAWLLKDVSQSVSEISRACGFRDAEYFSSTFKKYYGVSPSQWRDAQQ